MVDRVDPIIVMLTAERVRRGWSQSDVQRAIPCAGGLISRAERGFHAPTLPILRRWASVLGMEIVLTPRSPDRVVVAPAVESAE